MPTSNDDAVVERVFLFYSDHGPEQRGWCYTLHYGDGECECVCITNSAEWPRSQAREYAESMESGVKIEDADDDYFGRITGGKRD